MGSTEYEGGNGIEVDSQGNAFITGSTQSPNFPITPGANDTEFNGGSYDIFVLKLNSNGSQLKYSTFIGGSNYDYGRAIAIDSAGNAYVTGDTRSDKFPVTSGAFDPSYNDLEEVIVFKLNHNGSKLVYSTYIGGNDTDRPYDIAVDSIGNAFITGYTRSIDFPTILGSNDTSFNDDRDVIILKLNPMGSGLIYSTFIGDIEEEIGYGIVIDTSGNAYVTGYTRSTNFPVTQNAYDMSHNGSLDVFALKLSQDGKKLVHSTFIGGSNSDIGRDITIDSLDNVYVTGGTYSSDFPTTPNAFNRSSENRNEIFVFKLNKTGSQLLYSTYIPGNELDEGYGIDVDPVGNTYITGHTTSTNFPITLNAYDIKLDSREAFLIKLNSSGSTIIYCTYLGGNGSDYGRAITLDLMNNAYIVGRTYDTGFPYTPGAFNGTYGGSGDVFVSKFSFRPIINITSLFLYKDNNQTNKIYSRWGSYTFKIDFIYTANLSELGTICLILDPLGANIQLQWDYSSLQFSEISDINNYITIDPSSRAYNNIYRWSIEFNLTFDWTYPDENFHNAQVIATSAKLSPVWFNASDFYCVENDLAFNGTLLVEGEKSRIIENDDIVRGGENLTFTGLTVVYENTTDVYPLNNEFKVTISDENENDWVVSPNSGEPFYIDLFTPKVTHTKWYNYTIKITDIPKECDKSNNTFMIRIDADNVSFSDIIPDNNTWNTAKDVLVGINITDTGGGVVNSSTIMHSISINNGNSWGNWVLVPNLGYAMCVVVKHTVTLIKWRATDSIGNGPTESKFFRILVDTKSVEFSNAWPSGADVSLTEEVEVGITISDKTSGVNAPTIEYSISKDTGKIWNSWQKVEGLNNGLKIDVHINLTFPNGTNNMLKWRATDIAGNDPVESPPQTINVNTWTPPIIPEITLISPLNAITINTTSVNLTWELIDPNLNNITFDIFFDAKNPPDMLRSEVVNASYRIDDLKDGEIYYWRIISYKDRILRNSFKSDILWFKIELPIEKIYRITIMGPEIISLYQGERTNLSLTITNLGTNDDTINVKIQESNISEYIQLNDYSFLSLNKGNFGIRTLIINVPEDAQPGKYEIIVIAISINSDEKVISNHMITLEIKKINGQPNGDGWDQDGGPQDKGGNLNNLMLILLIIIILIIIILSVLFLVLKKKKREAEKLSTETSVTTKPLPTQVISVGEVKPQAIQTSLQQPTQTVIPSSKLQPQVVTTHSLPTLAQQPSVSTTEKISQVPSIIQTAQTPQLPPAKIPSTSTEPLPVSPETPTPTLKPKVAPETPETYATPVIKPN